jgi:uncharacterized protein YidB (DUF937 family)
MGLLDGIIGGFVGGEMATVVNGLIAKHGGLGGLVSSFEQNGLGATVKSWVGTGPNATISGDELHRVLGADVLQPLAAKLGISSQDLAQKLAQVLPGVVDKLTPDGVVPSA